ncbi:MAG: DUF190 domain-containing protein [Steroidobacteraceae bacterium]
MKGYQLTFFTEQNRKRGHEPLGEWLLKFLMKNGAVGASLFNAAEGVDHTGRFHSAHFFELADQPLMITASCDEAAFQRLMKLLAEEDFSLAYVIIPVEYGHVGRA